MKASQYIYTACGKDRTGAFSVFSKSRDITDVESSEIREMMGYKTPSGLPYEPTESEIEDLFPKKFGYFFLSSGRACLAQVCYVGRVYSDLDVRVGNYIIHAFVFDKNDNFAPYSFIEHTLFKRLLTKKEWHDDPILNELPQKDDIPENGNGALQASELVSFLNEDRKSKLTLLIEAIINSSIENPVRFCDNHKNINYWIKALSVCLPKSKQNTVSLCSHFTNTLMPGNNSSRIQIRINQPDGDMLNYAQEAQKGRYAFDFKKNVIPEFIKPGKYAENVVRLLSSGRFFETVQFADNINKVISNYESVNIDQAVDLANLYISNYSAFKDDELYDTILKVDNIGYEKQSIANNLWSKKSQSNFNNVEKKLKFFAFIYKNISEMDTRVEIIKTIIDKAELFGILTDDATVFSNDLRSKASFIFENYLVYLKAEGLNNYLLQNKKSFPKLYIAFDILIKLPLVKNLFQTQNYNASEEEFVAVKSIMMLAFEQKSLSDIDLLIKSAGEQFGIELLSIILNKSNAQNPETDFKFTFEILKRLSKKIDVVYDYMSKLINIHSGKDEFIKAYIESQNNNPDFYKKFEEEKTKEPSMTNFFKKKDKFNFAHKEQVTYYELNEYFKKYYVTNEDNEKSFIKRLKEYLSTTIEENQRIEKCIEIYGLRHFSKDVGEKLLLPVYKIILESIFSASCEKIYESQDRYIDSILEIYSVVEKAKFSLKQETEDLLKITKFGYGIIKSKKQESLLFKNDSSIDFSTCSNKSIDIFVQYYFQYVVKNLIIEVTDYDKVLKEKFQKIIEIGNFEKIKDVIIEEIEKCKIDKDKDKDKFILYLFKKHLLESPDEFDKKLGNIANTYFKELPAGERKKTFSKLLDLAKKTEVEQFKKYFDEFNKQHKSGLLSGLLSFFDISKRKSSPT